jgi:hypothetical protein
MIPPPSRLTGRSASSTCGVDALAHVGAGDGDPERHTGTPTLRFKTGHAHK